MTRFEEYCKRGVQAHGSKFTPPEGDAFIAAYNKGQDFRIKVFTPYVGSQVRGHARWGYVGITSGWAPCFLLMHRAGNTGSSDVLDHRQDVIVESKWIDQQRRRK